MGELQYGASFSYAETLDLISDGPIEGLVNPLGKVMEGIDILQGIYLDDTAVAISNDATTTQINVAARPYQVNGSWRVDEDTGVRALRNFF